MLRGALSTVPSSPSVPRFRLPAEAFPLIGAFFAISFAFGVLARESGLGPTMAVLMSAFVYAGTSQVVALGLIATGQPGWVIVFVTFLINARLFLMGSVFAHSVARWNPWARFLFASQLTDETFAVLLPSRDSQNFEPRRAICIQATAYLGWVAGTLLGFTLQTSSTQLYGLGLDFALVAMVLGVLVLQLRDIKGVLVALAGGGVAIGATLAGLGWMSILLAALVAPLFGLYLERRWTAYKS